MRERRKRPTRSRRKRVARLDDAYLRAVKKLEALPQNRSGADKSWVERALRSWREHYDRAVRVR